MRKLLAKLLLSACAVVASLTLAAEAQAEKRVALVIGNGTYKNTIELPNAPNDAREVAGAFRRLGFTVVEGINLGQAQMTEKLREFSRALVGADVGVFFYAGHGLQVAGENHLVAIDAALKRESDLEFETMKVDAVLRQMQRETKIKVVILDACRDNPLAQELTRTMASTNTGARARSSTVAAGMGAIDANTASGTLIAFATAPGSVALDGAGANSPFTEALLAHMETPGIDIDIMMKRVRGQVTRVTNERQQPWTNSSLTAEFYLNPVSSGAVAQASGAAASGRLAAASQSTAGQAAASGQPTANSSTVTAALPNPAGEPSQPRTGGFDPRQMELALWQEAMRHNSTVGYQAYLEAYPNGTFAALAQRRIDSFEAKTAANTAAATAAAPPAPVIVPPARSTSDVRTAEASGVTEDQLQLDQKDWKDVQRRLTALGFSTNGVDGEVGPGTRKALSDWQKARGYPVAGFLNEPQHRALLSERAPDKKVAARTKDEEEPKPKARARSSQQSSSGQSERRQPRSSGESQAQQSNNTGAALIGGLLVGGAVGLAIGRSRRR